MGRAWKFGDDVSTDAIIPGRYLTSNDPKELAKHAFENQKPNFNQRAKQGDIIVAGENFGCGSSREHAPLAILGSGIKAIIAKSFARIFYRNAINVGLYVFETQKTDKIEERDQLEIKDKKIVDKTKDQTYKPKKFPEFIDQIIQKGGLLNYIEEKKDV
ncbi:3-isopropylmalate dehydratase [archaeon SCG-AAA382B04]|nr:3-isopropylmalate dehydratase [archaeon SCG-AAA382B04]